ncbi:MAG: hypothetical protein AB1861_08170 [Cyanobacteriota bacterium]
MPLLLLSGFFSHSGQQKNGVGRSLELSRSHPLHKTRSRSRVTERSPKLGWGSLNPSC